MKQVVLSFLLVLLEFYGFGQNPSFINYAIEDGLPSNETYCSFQDNEGYIWIGTDRGVARFDGYEFEVFTTEDGLPGNTVFRFYQDHKDRIWFLTFNGNLGFYFHDKFYAVDLDLKDKSNLHSIFVSADDRITFECKSTEGRVFSFQMLGDTIADKKVNVELEKINYSVFQQDSLLNLPLKQRLENQKVLRKDYQSYKFGDGAIHNQVKISDSSLACPIVDFVGIDIFNRDFSRQKSILLENGSIVSGLGKLGSYWFVTSTNNKVYIYESAYPFRCLKQMDLKDFTPSNVMEDCFGGLWITTLNNGILHMPNQQVLIRNFDSPFALTGLEFYRRNGNSEIFVNRKGKVLLWQGNIVLSESPIEFRTNNLKLSQSGILVVNYHEALKLDDFGNVEKRWREKELVRKDTFPLLRQYSDLEISSSENLIGCNINNVFVNDFVIYEPEATRMKRIQLQGDTIWVAGLKGLFAFSESQRSKISFERYPLLKNRINEMALLNDHLILTTRAAGVLVKKGDQLIQIKEENGLISNSVNRIAKNDKNTIWVSSNKGISKIKFDSENANLYTIENLGLEDGIVKGQINDLQWFRDSLYVLTDNNLYRFHEDYFTNPTAPKIHVRLSKINDSIVNLSGGLVFNHAQNNLEFAFTGLYYPNAQSLLYSYTIDEGETWRTTKNRTVPLLNIAPGSYAFMVKAITNKGVESEVRQVEFEIKPPFWQTWWFLLAVALLISLAVYLVVRRTISRIRKEGAVQAELYKLENKALSSQMNPHFIFNALTAIQHYIIKQEKYEAYNYLNRFATLIRAILKNSEEGRVPLSEELDLLRDYLELEKIRFSDNFDYTIDVESMEGELELMVPSMLIQPYTENSIRHGFLHKEAKGNLKILFSLEANDLKCVIEDDGVGRERARELKKDLSHKSFAMGINERRLMLLNEIEHKDLSIEIEDLYNSAGEAVGTRVTLHVPVD